MGRVNRPASDNPPPPGRIDPDAPPSPGTRPFGLSPAVAGTACCVVSALGYSGANVCLRKLAQLQADEMWVVCNKELVTVAVVGPWLLWRAARRLPVLPPPKTLAILLAVGLAVQMGANLGVQFAMGVVGLAIAVPSIFGVMLTASAVLGRVVLGERVSRRSMAAIGVLLASLPLLGVAADVARQAPSEASTAAAVTDDGDDATEATTAKPDAHGPLTVAAAVAAACLAGAIYSVLTITIRHTVSGSTNIGTVVFFVTVTGVISLGGLSIYRLGIPALVNTPPIQLAWMLAAGTLNLIAFLAISKGLELTTVVQVNVLNASQVAMAALAGLIWFAEPPSVWLILGVCVTIAGVVMIDRPVEVDPA